MWAWVVRNWYRTSWVLVAIIFYLPQVAFSDGPEGLTPADFENPADSFIVNLLKIVFTPRYFEPHWVHFVFDPGLMWSMVISNVVVFVAYTLIPIALIYFLFRRKDVFASKVIYLFGAFIVMCGLHHLVHVVTFWYPIYHFQNIVDVITAIVSMATFFALINVLPDAIKLRTPKDLEKLNNELEEKTVRLQESLRKNEETRDLLEKKVEERTEELKMLNVSLEEKIRERTKELEKNLEETKRINAIMFDRELKMIELKKEIAALKGEK